MKKDFPIVCETSTKRVLRAKENESQDFLFLGRFPGVRYSHPFYKNQPTGKLTMFCYHCEQTVEGVCTKVGVCGKNHEVAVLQDLLTYVIRGLCHFAVSGRRGNINDDEINRFTMKGIF